MIRFVVYGLLALSVISGVVFAGILFFSDTPSAAYGMVGSLGVFLIGMHALVYAIESDKL